MISYYAYPGLKLAYLTPEQLEGIKKRNQAFFKSDDFVTIVRDCVCQFYSVTQQQIEGKRGKGILPWARHVFVFLCRKYTYLTLKNIADILNRDHTTAIHSIKTVHDHTSNYSEFKSQLEAIEINIDDRIYAKIGTINSENTPVNQH